MPSPASADRTSDNAWARSGWARRMPCRRRCIRRDTASTFPRDPVNTRIRHRTHIGSNRHDTRHSALRMRDTPCHRPSHVSTLRVHNVPRHGRHTARLLPRIAHMTWRRGNSQTDTTPRRRIGRPGMYAGVRTYTPCCLRHMTPSTRMRSRTRHIRRRMF